MKKNPLIPTLVLAGATSLAAMLTPVAAKAVTYNVDRSWSDGSNNASLVGTVAVPVGSYTLQEGDTSPFTNVNLSLTINSSAFPLRNSYVSVNGNGLFLINATSSELIFDTANATDTNSAGFTFYDPDTGAHYLIRTYDSKSNEIGDDRNGSSVSSTVTVPVTFGTAQSEAVPEPLTILGTGVVLGAIPALKKEYAKRNKKKNGDA